MDGVAKKLTCSRRIENGRVEEKKTPHKFNSKANSSLRRKVWENERKEWKKKKADKIIEKKR